MLIAHALILALATSSWLDAPAPSNWNAAGATIPRAPHADMSMNPRCIAAKLTRRPISAADRAIVAAGWMLFNKPVAIGANVIVDGQSGFDGMCRPTYYQAFVFSAGRFAGTLAPHAMQSRALGSLQTAAFTGTSKISARFNHYADADPLCCPSRLTNVAYRIDATPRGPVVAPVSTRTYRTQ